MSVFRSLRDNALSLALFGLFVLAIVAQALTGLAAHNREQVLHGQPSSGLSHYLVSGAFLDGVFNNWQAALLQLATLIIFTRFLRQRGASHSRKGADANKRSGHRARKCGGRRRSWIYRNSLSIAFVLLFAGSFALHVIEGTAAENERRSMLTEPQTTVASYSVSPRFWFSTLQTWQAEYFAIAAFVVLSVSLRQEGSAESKRPEASDDETGETNE